METETTEQVTDKIIWTNDVPSYGTYPPDERYRLLGLDERLLPEDELISSDDDRDQLFQSWVNAGRNPGPTLRDMMRGEIVGAKRLLSGHVYDGTLLPLTRLAQPDELVYVGGAYALVFRPESRNWRWLQVSPNGQWAKPAAIMAYVGGLAVAVAVGDTQVDPAIHVLLGDFDLIAPGDELLAWDHDLNEFSWSSLIGVNVGRCIYQRRGSYPYGGLAVRRKAGLPIARFKPDKLIPDSLLALIRQDPAQLLIRGLVRNAYHVVLPSEVQGQGADAIVAYIGEHYKVLPADVLAPPPPSRPTAQAQAETRSVDFEISEEITGSTTWTRTDTHSGSIAVPLAVIADGSETVEDWIRNNWRRRGNYDTDSGDCRNHQDDDESTDETSLESSSASEVCDSYAEDQEQEEEPIDDDGE